MTGEIHGNRQQMIQISNAPVPAKQTTQIVYKANLPTRPRDDEPGNRRFRPSGVGELRPPATTPVPRPESYDGLRNDDTRFLSQSVSGGSVTVYDAVGQPINVEMRWAKTSNPWRAAHAGRLEPVLSGEQNPSATGSTRRGATSAGPSSSTPAAR